MNVLVTGADDVWGYLTVKQILSAGTLKNSKNEIRPVEKVVLVCHQGPYLPDILEEERVKVVIGSIADASSIRPIILDNEIDSVFHFETLVSDRGEGENAFEDMLNVNLIGSLNILRACKDSGRCPKVVFCASCSVFADHLGIPAREDLRRMPASTYGSTKACVELLIANFTRRGFVDGRNSLLPMCVSWMPTPPNTDFMHQVFFSPFDGADVVTPLRADTRLWFNGYYTDILNLIETHDIPSELLGDDRSIIQPGISATVREIYEMFVKVGEEEGVKVGKLIEQFDPAVQESLDVFCKSADVSRAESFGLTNDDLETVVRRYLRDYQALEQRS